MVSLVTGGTSKYVVFSVVVDTGRRRQCVEEQPKFKSLDMTINHL